MGLFDLLKRKSKIEQKIDSKVKSKPTVIPKDKNMLTVKVVGTEYRNTNDIIALGKQNPDYNLDKRNMIKKFPDGATVYEYEFPEYEGSFEFEPTNEYDSNAIKVLIQGIHVGYVKKGSCARIKNLINQNKITSIKAKIYGGNSKNLYCYVGMDEKPTSSDYEFEKNKGNIYVKLTLSLIE